MAEAEQRFIPCVVIPVYRHVHLVEGPLRHIQDYGLPCIVVDDGNDAASSQTLQYICEITESALVKRPNNGGKGAAVLSGMRYAAEQGYTHVLQMDADGQHNSDDIPRLLQRAEKEPDALITGVPAFDDSVPRHRLYSRYITHIWVWLETLSLEIRDSMCGFRVYPLKSTLALADRVRLGRGMDFDIEILVRLSWRGVPIRSVSTQVVYPENGVSNFKLWQDNVAISWLHTRLFFGMLMRFPWLLLRRRVLRR